ncbi:MAG: hypothetical protein LCH52_08435 [Bacteroidetes bacterium]|nr:hypothetical protein [Bacteroidota bacterium]
MVTLFNNNPKESNILIDLFFVVFLWGIALSIIVAMMFLDEKATAPKMFFAFGFMTNFAFLCAWFATHKFTRNYKFIPTQSDVFTSDQTPPEVGSKEDSYVELPKEKT